MHKKILLIGLGILVVVAAAGALLSTRTDTTTENIDDNLTSQEFVDNEKQNVEAAIEDGSFEYSELDEVYVLDIAYDLADAGKCDELIEASETLPILKFPEEKTKARLILGCLRDSERESDFNEQRELFKTVLSKLDDERASALLDNLDEESDFNYVKEIQQVDPGDPRT